MGLLSSAKDRLAEQVALTWLNGTVLQTFGRATRLRIDSKAKRVELALELKGESQPVEVTISNYELSTEGERVYATLNGIQTSREWLTIAAKHVAGRRFPLPPTIGNVLLKYF